MPIMKVYGDVRHDWHVVLGHMHWPRDPKQAAVMAKLAEEGQRFLDSGAEIADELARLQGADLVAGKADKPLKGKPLPSIGSLAGHVLITVVQLAQHQPRRASVALAAHILECATARGELRLFDGGKAPAHADSYRQAFNEFRPAASLWAAHHCFGSIDSSPEEIANEIRCDFGQFLALAGAFLEFAKGHISRDQPLISKGESWRTAAILHLDRVDVPRYPAPMNKDLESYKRRDR